MYAEETEDEAEPSTSGSSNLMSFSGRGSFNDTVGRSLELGGRPAMAMRLALGSISDRLSESVGVKTGVEWRAARVAAEELGSQVGVSTLFSGRYSQSTSIRICTIQSSDDSAQETAVLASFMW